MRSASATSSFATRRTSGIPKEVRAELHERFADWLGRRRATGARLEEIVGYHLEQAYRYARGARPARRAGGARSASARPPAASPRADRADARRRPGRRTTSSGERNSLLPKDTGVARALPRSSPVSGDAGDFSEAARGARAGSRPAAQAGDAERMPPKLRLARDGIASHTGSHRARTSSPRSSGHPVSRESGDGGRSPPCFEHGKLTFWLGSAERGQASLVKAREHARRAGDRGAELQALSWQTADVMFGPVPVEEADAFTLESSRPIGRAPTAGADDLEPRHVRGHGRPQARRREVSVSRRGRSMRDTASRGHGHYQFGGQIELLCGEAEAAEALLRAGCENSLRLGETAISPRPRPISPRRSTAWVATTRLSKRLR